jgi:hypothetical protein
VASKTEFAATHVSGAFLKAMCRSAAPAAVAGGQIGATAVFTVGSVVAVVLLTVVVVALTVVVVELAAGFFVPPLESNATRPMMIATTTTTVMERRVFRDRF